ncbi:ribosome biogenesis GTPase Der [Campylobacter geochelonis]|uniref:GTPase Der n=1 Tax=Campylobacter geochelonis TaxID=1780362 RepID=A0A128EEJ6_9BACT|nr:ribosome biogenesis GTPase Der [Campylobacter geochelonis]QKF71827.1 GTP-binding protein [Campylobacter geochelonis]CZE46961.1 GTP-binding protein EngA [Campylobacter geochelonis]CZE47447.1 GTP-binding protein EngA [Campylobacter geochelonis]CZE50932.1 GTP-binding protein EngA [Campylobacter geochelonis]
MQKVILIGRPNVGKSSLFNRLAKQRIAITSDISGTTRDTNKTQIEIFDRFCVLVDSGGLDESTEMFAKVQQKTLEEAKNSDIIVFMVDGKFMPQDEDKRIFYSLLKLDKPTALVINKIDGNKDEERSFEFNEFGAKNSFGISVSHNSGVDDLKSWIYRYLEDEIKPDVSLDLDEFLENFDENGEILEEKLENYDEKPIKVGIIGRVNVGKSSLLNALVKESRSVVSPTAGTTIDPVNESFIYEDRIYEFVDTAGIRKRGKIEGIEKFALNRTEAVLEQTDIALLVLDSSEPLTELDERIAGIASKFELGIIIVLNKWENKSEAEFERIREEIRDKFKFLAYAPIISVSALGGKRVHKLYPMILEIYKNFTQKIQTSKLNEMIAEATKTHPIPHEKGKVVKIYYAVQFGFAPPKIALVMNRPRSLHFSYKRYLTNKMRERFNLSGVPVVLIPKNRGSSDEEK